MTLHTLSATAARDAIAQGHVSSEELVRACLARIAAREPAARAWSFIDAEGALTAARNADKTTLLNEGPLPPLHGVPFAIKDVIDAAGLPTEHNSLLFQGHRPARDAACVAILRAAGAIPLGKVETVEFAARGRLPTTRNPHDPARTPGGSSSGSAVAVAEAMVPLALGTQTGGSVIRPAAFCGVYGFKPTYGTVSTEGAKRFSVTLDTIGWFARTLADIALVCEVLAVSDRPAAPPRAASALRLGVCRTPYWDRAEPAMRAAFDDALMRLAGAGTTLVTLELDARFGAINDLKETVMRAEGRAAFLDLQRSSPHLLSSAIRALMTRGDDRALCAALDEAAALRPVFDQLAGEVDAVLTPSTRGVAPVGLHFSGDPIFNGLWSLLHVPCLTLPVLQSPEGLPLGLQLVAPRYEDARLLGTAATVAAVLS